MKTKNSVKITKMILGAVIALSVLAAIFYFWVNPSQTVSAAGDSVVKVMPDLVTVYFAVETTGNTAREAKDKNSEIVDDVITGLIKSGLNREEIVTENFNIYPEYDWKDRNREIKGYRAMHNLKIELKEDKMNIVGDVIDAGVNAGATINYINFELSQEKQNHYKAQALEEATQDARAKAEGIARGLSKRIGRVVSVSSSDFEYHPWILYREGAGVEEAKEAVTNIQPGEQEVRGRVTVVYTLI